LIFVTNNSTKSRSDYKKKFDKLGIPNISEEDVFGSSYCAAIYISNVLKLSPPENKVFVLGESGIEQELASESIPVVGGTDSAFRRDIDQKDFDDIASGKALDPNVAIVLMGLDFHFNYLKLALAQQYLRRGATFLATNIDRTLPMSGGFFPGTGAVGAGIVKASGLEPLPLGKPSQAMMQAIEGKFHLQKERTCMVGDNLSTDIRFGIEGGLGGTLMVLTGVNTEEEILAKDAPVVPKFYVEKLGDILMD